MESDLIRNRLLAVLVLLATVAAVKIGYPVLMPIVLSFCIIASAWPIKRWAASFASRRMSYVITILVLIAGTILFFMVVSFALSEVVRGFVDRQDEFGTLVDRYSELSDTWGLPAIDSVDVYQRVVGLLQRFLSDIYTLLSYVGVVAVITILSFPEVPKLASKFRVEYETEDNRAISQTILEMSQSLRSYLAITTLTGFITGLASALWAMTLGLDLAIIWGILNFLLNFIPIVGNVLGIVPPTLYAFVQYGRWLMPLVVFTGFVALQLVISNFVYPMLQSKGVALPPATIVLSLLFWSWLWGIAGGVLAVPLTAMLVIVCSKFEATRKFAIFVGGADADDRERSHAK